MITPIDYVVPDNFYSIGNYTTVRRPRTADSQNPKITTPLLDVISLSAAALRIIDQYERLEKMNLNIKE